MRIAKALGQIVTNSSPPHRRLELAFSEHPSPYFRFNVDRGLESVVLDEWAKYQEVYSHTEGYMQEPEQKAKMAACVRCILAIQPYAYNPKIFRSVRSIFRQTDLLFQDNAKLLCSVPRWLRHCPSPHVFETYFRPLYLFQQ